MAEFKIKDGNNVKTRLITVASATVIPAGSLVALSSGVAIKAVAASAALAFTPGGSADGETEMTVTIGNDFTLVGTADANAAVTDKGAEVDLVGTTTLLIDIGASTTDVFKVGIAADSLVDGSTLNVEVRINKPLF